MTEESPPQTKDDARPRTRSDFVWDVLALQVKLLIGSLLSFVLGPATFVAALMDLVFKSEAHGSRFYRVLDWGRKSEEALDLYAALNRKYDTIDMHVELAPTKDEPTQSK